MPVDRVASRARMAVTAWRHGHLLRITVLVTFLLILGLHDGVASADQTVTIPQTTLPIRIDGVLDEEAWTSAVDLGALTQREPREGAAPSEPTRVRLLIDDNNLYIGILNTDTDSGAIVRSQMTRDGDLGQDDNIEIVLDTFLDRRNGYYFQVNALGAQADGLISNNNEPNKQWDGIWDSRAARTPDGWTVEIAIPFKTVNFDPAQDAWGFNLQRTIRRRQETIRWQAARQNMRLAQLAEAGTIGGLAGRRQGRGLDVRPYLSGGGARDRRGRPLVGNVDAGLDVVKNLTPSLTATLTVNTDFAETEVDARQVNLTRFSLFFPEKRAFFLQNAGAFQTAGQGQRADQLAGNDIVPFFTRRIGLAGGEPLPILAGAKLAGRVGGWNVGILDVATRSDRGFEGRNFFTARVSRNLGRQSMFGALFTHGNPDADDPRPLVGVDGRYAISTLFGNKNLVAEGALFRTFAANAPGVGEWAGSVRIDYPNDPFSVNLTFKEIGTNFVPGLGFIPRRGIRKGTYNIDFFQRPGKWGIRSQHWELLTDVIHSPDWRVLNWRIFTAPLNIRTEAGEHFEWNYMPEYEYLDVPFEIRRGIVVPAGGYVMHRYRAEVNTATKRKIIGDISIRHGDFYDGRRTETSLGLRYRPSVHLSLQAGLSRNNVDLSAGSFVTNIWSARADIGISPQITINNLLQYDDVSRVAGLNTRFRWILRPGNDVFFVLNLGRLHDELDRWVSAYERVTSKVQYTWRF